MVITILVLIHKLLQILLHNALDIYINGKRQIVAVRCIDHCTLQIGAVIQISVFTAGGSVQRAVVVLLQPKGSLIAASGKSKHVRQKCSVRVASGIRGFKPDSLNILILAVGCLRILKLSLQICQLCFICSPLLLRLHFLLYVGYAVCSVRNFFLVGCFLLIGQAFFGNIVAGVRIVVDVLLHRAPVQAETLTGCQRRLLVAALSVLILRPIVDLVRIHNNVVNQLTCCQHRPVSVSNGSALIGDLSGIIGLLGEDLAFVIIAVVFVDVCNSYNKRDKSQQYQTEQYYQLCLHFFVELPCPCAAGRLTARPSSRPLHGVLVICHL